MLLLSSQYVLIVSYGCVIHTQNQANPAGYSTLNSVHIGNVNPASPLET